MLSSELSMLASSIRMAAVAFASSALRTSADMFEDMSVDLLQAAIVRTKHAARILQFI